MKTKKFKDLSPRKKAFIIDAIGTVLADKGVEGCNVCDLIKESEMSRATFYNYFKDKNDALEEYTKYYIVKYIDFMNKLLEKNGYDFIATFIESHYYFTTMFKDQLYDVLQKNLKNINHISWFIGLQDMVEEAYPNFIKEIYNKIDKKKLPIKNIKQMEIVVQMLWNIAITTCAKLEIGKDSDEMNSSFEKKVAIVEEGIKSLNHKR